MKRIRSQSLFHHLRSTIPYCEPVSLWLTSSLIFWQFFFLRKQAATMYLRTNEKYINSHNLVNPPSIEWPSRVIVRMYLHWNQCLFSCKRRQHKNEGREIKPVKVFWENHYSWITWNWQHLAPKTNKERHNGAPNYYLAKLSQKTVP